MSMSSTIMSFFRLDTNASLFIDFTLLFHPTRVLPMFHVFVGDQNDGPTRRSRDSYHAINPHSSAIRVRLKMHHHCVTSCHLKLGGPPHWVEEKFWRNPHESDDDRTETR
mmetsp:Transcript_17268/g.35873  ORF Transcript_17268/g.35873 Transcript_17268/m.35873 type:complete len:110 (-) Transcript_17268:54-383(-)